MFKSFLIAACFSFVSATALAQFPQGQAPAVAQSPPLPVLSPEQAHEDFDLLRHALEDAHPGLYRYSTKPEIERSFDNLRAKLNAPLPAADFEAIVAEALADIRCGHTSLSPDPQLESAMRDAETFPLRVMVQESALVVMLNDTASDSTLRPGTEILEINGRKVSDILNPLYSHLSADGDIQTGKRHDVTGRFSHYYWWLIEKTDRFTIKARDASGAVFTSTLQGVTDADRKSNHNPVNAPVMAAVGKIFRWANGNHAFRYIHEPDVAELRLNYFLGDDFPAALESTFKTLRDRKTKSLIIDLRGNGGGKDEYGALLVSYLTPKPFRYFDRIHIKTLDPSSKQYMEGFDALKNTPAEGKTLTDPAGGFLATPKLHPGLALQQPAKFPFTGKVFVLTDGGTFSTAADFCAIVHSLGRATFVGEETGGGYYGNNSGPMPTLTLPHSRAQIRFPMYAYYNAVSDPKLSRRGTIPQEPVTLKISDLLNGSDAVLDRAVQLAQRER